MNIRKSYSLLVALVSLGVTASAQTQTSEATVASVTGQATLTRADGSSAALAAGMKVPQGATIVTGTDGDVMLQSHAGYVTAIKKNSTVVVEEVSVTSANGKVQKENTTLDLKGGNLVAMLDPKKKAVNNFQVRTPKGVAAARGTVFTVTVQYGTSLVTVAVINGRVSISSTGTQLAGQTLQVDGGNIYTSSEVNPVSVLSAAQTEMLALAVAAVAVAADKGLVTAAEAKQVAASVVRAVPDAAAAVKDAVSTSAPNQSTNINSGVQEGRSQSTFETIAPNVTTPQPIKPENVSRSG